MDTRSAGATTPRASWATAPTTLIDEFPHPWSADFRSRQSRRVMRTRAESRSEERRIAGDATPAASSEMDRPMITRHLPE
jgi:hypothetical protein